MPTNIEIDDALITRALEVTGLKSTREVVEEGLRTLIRLHGQRDSLSLAGKVRWSGELGETRQGRNAQ
jgi:Arc/MetJ family transcription regulator